MAQRGLLVLGAGPAQLGLLATARRLGIATVAADRDPAAPGFRYARRRAVVARDDEPALDRLARAEGIDGVVAPGSDRTPAIAARIAAKLGLPQPLRPEAAHALSARQRERAALAAAGLPQPEAVVCETLVEVRRAAERLGYPCAVGALDRPGGTAVVLESPPQLAAAVASATAGSRVAPCIVEELRASARLLVAGLATPGGFRPLLVADDDPAGPLWPVPAPAAGAAAALAARAVGVLGIEGGAVEVRVAVGDDGLHVAGVAARLGRRHEPELCRAAVGVDLHRLALRAALGDAIAPAELAPAPRAGAACIRLLPPAAAGGTPAGIEDAFAVAGIAGIRVYRGRDRGGAILATGADRDAALAAAGRALALIRFERADAEAVA